MQPSALSSKLQYVCVLPGRWHCRGEDRGSVTLQQIVIMAIVFAVAVWAVTEIVAAIHTHANQLK